MSYRVLFECQQLARIKKGYINEDYFLRSNTQYRKVFFKLELLIKLAIVSVKDCEEIFSKVKLLKDPFSILNDSNN